MLAVLTRPVAVLAAGLATIAASLAALVVVTRAGAWHYPVAANLPVDLAIGVTFPAAAVATLAGRQPGRLGWLLLTVGALCGANNLAVAAVAAGPDWALVPAAQLQSWLWIPGVLPLVTLVPLLYPDGRLPSRRWRPALWAACAGTALLTAGIAAHPDTIVGRVAVVKPLTSDALAVPLTAAAVALLLPATAGGVAALLVRLRASTGLRRRQIVVFLAAALVVLADFLVQPLLPSPAGLVSQVAATACLPLAIGVAITRHRLYDLDLAVCRALVVVSLAGCLAGGYVVVLAALTVLPAADPVRTGLAAGAVGLTVQPLARRLSRAVDRLFYGERANPYAVSARLAGRLSAGLDVTDVPELVCATIVGELRLPGATLALGADRESAPVARAGDPDGPDGVEFPLRHRGRTVGVLTARPRAGELALTERDTELLTVLADQVAPAVAALALNAALQRSREALVTAREEERRRLHRDLHDGLGAALAGLRLQVESARERVADSVTRRLLDAAGDTVTEAVADVRRISEDLRPPALDEVGLPGSLSGLATRLNTPGLAVEADVADLGPLPAAVEVACYRIAAEALTNAVRHAKARRVRLSVSADPAAVRLLVEDDGTGMTRSWRPGGLGLESMRQRTEEIGGTFTITTSPAGTTVRATLPRSDP